MRHSGTCPSCNGQLSVGVHDQMLVVQCATEHCGALHVEVEGVMRIPVPTVDHDGFEPVATVTVWGKSGAHADGEACMMEPRFGHKSHTRMRVSELYHALTMWVAMPIAARQLSDDQAAAALGLTLAELGELLTGHFCAHSVDDLERLAALLDEAGR